MDAITQQPEWMRERAVVLQKICEGVRASIATGSSRETALQNACKAHAGTLIGQVGNEKPLKLSVPTLRRLFRQWREGGENVAAFEMNYRPGKSRVPVDLVNEFQRLATMPGMRKTSVAYNELVKRWRNGLPVPGLGIWPQWWAANRIGMDMPHAAPEFPFSERSLYRYQPKKTVRALGNKGMAAFKRESVSITRTTADLRPCELFVLDDKRPDILVLNDETGKASDITIYLMQEVGCRRIVGFTCRPANAMNSSDVDALIARVLEAEGFSTEYVTHILLERGTVAMTPAAQQLIEAVTNGQVKIHRTSMDEGMRALGFASDRPSGHWQGKGTMEAFCGKLDLMLMHLPGQRGNNYANQPANLAWSMRRKYVGKDGLETVREISGGEAAQAEALAQLEVACGRKLGLDCGLLWMSEFNLILRQIIKEHNASRDHDYEGFSQVTQREVAPGVWEDVA
jgi:hypothetical protein